MTHPEGSSAISHGLPLEPPATAPEIKRAWHLLLARYLTGRSYDFDPTQGTDDDDAADLIVAEYQRLQRELLLFPAPDAVALSEKFRVFREFLEGDFAIFWDRRELLFLAALEADALRLAETTEA